jgi:hypothetical protein
VSPAFRSNVETQTNNANLEDLNCGAETPVTPDESFALQTFALAIMSSLPQPTIAVPVFFFVEHFIAWESVALGFAAGAMLWVACFELLADAMQEVSMSKCALCLGSACALMICVSRWLDNATELAINLAEIHV